MKYLISLMIGSMIILSSCGNNPQSEQEKATEATEEAYEKAVDEADLKEAKDCDEFIDQYEEWMDDYCVLLEDYMKNPMDASLMEKFQEMGLKANFWMTQWTGKLYQCASREKYQKRFDEISEKAEKKMKELGLD